MTLEELETRKFAELDALESALKKAFGTACIFCTNKDAWKTCGDASDCELMHRIRAASSMSFDAGYLCGRLNQATYYSKHKEGN